MGPRKQAANFATQPRQVLAGSEKTPSPTPAEKPATGKVTVSVIVRRKNQIAPRTLGKVRVTRAQYAQSYAAEPADLKQIRAFAKEFGLTVEKTPAEAARRTVQLTGTVAAMQKAFGVQLKTATIDGTPCRVREGAIQIPASLANIVIAVLGLDTRPQARPHFRVFNPSATTIRPNASTTNISYTPVQVGQLYHRHRPDHRYHRARRRLPHRRHHRLLQNPRPPRAHSHGRLGRQGEKLPHHRQRRRRRSHARHRGRRCRRARR